MLLEPNMFLWFMLLGSVLTSPTDEFGEFTKHGSEDIIQKHDSLQRNIVPAGMSPHKSIMAPPDDVDISELVALELNNKYFKIFYSYMQTGVTAKGLTFNIYDDNMREAAVALFRLFQTTEDDIFDKVQAWAKSNVNKDMYMYALRLESLYGAKTIQDDLLPPFIWNPHYFVNSEALAKASLIVDDIRTHGRIDSRMSKVDQFSKTFYTIDEFITINTNYSGWNLPEEAQPELDYFREDVSLNSYYLGLHLLHPFWMSNEELDFNNPRHAEHYYYAHQQLVARHELEKLHLSKQNKTKLGRDESDYVPYLTYKNGLPFPTRSCYQGDWTEERALLKNIDIVLRECIERGLIMMQNGTALIMTEDNHIEILAKIIRANLDGVKVAKIVRSIFGYGGNKYPMNEYNPAPSLLHHPETSLRDPVYWHIIQYVLNYFTEYKATMEPFDMTQYETNDVDIVDNEFTKITTYFDYYQFTVNYATSYTIREISDWPTYISVRQRRLKHLPFSFNFTVKSTTNDDAVVRLYLGPECINNCWDDYSKFYELDTVRCKLQKGINTIRWSPEDSDRYSFDHYFDTPMPRPDATRYSIFKFPENLLIPRGLEQGLNLTLFVIITSVDTDTVPYPPSFYRDISTQLDSKPLGFPFHRQGKGFKETANNYRFYNITVYHKHLPIDEKGYFSPHLY